MVCGSPGSGNDCNNQTVDCITDPLFVEVNSLSRAVARNDPDGMHVGFDAGGPVRISKVVIDTVNDGEPPWEFLMGPTTDARAMRGFNVKPVVNGSWDVSVTVTDDRGCSATAIGSHKVMVVIGG